MIHAGTVFNCFSAVTRVLSVQTIQCPIWYSVCIPSCRQLFSLTVVSQLLFGIRISGLYKVGVEKVTFFPLLKKLSTFQVIRRFVTLFRRARTGASWIHSDALISILILFFDSRLDLSSPAFPNRSSCAFLIILMYGTFTCSPICAFHWWFTFVTWSKCYIYFISSAFPVVCFSVSKPRYHTSVLQYKGFIALL